MGWETLYIRVHSDARSKHHACIRLNALHSSFAATRGGLRGRGRLQAVVFRWPSIDPCIDLTLP